MLSSLQNLFVNENVACPYTTYKAKTTYYFNAGTLLAPVAAPERAGGERTPAEIIQVSAPYGGKVVQYVAERQGKAPQVPSPEPNGNNQVLYTAEIVTESPDLMTEGRTYLYRVSGTYAYHFRQPVAFQDGRFYMGGAPFDLTPPSTHILSPGDFNRELMGPG